MTADHQAHRGSGWEAMHRNLAADAVVAEALLYASGGRRLTVEHGQPLTDQAAALVQQLVDDVDQAAAAAGYLGGGTVTSRGASITWTFPSTDSPRSATGLGRPSRCRPAEPWRLDHHARWLRLTARASGGRGLGEGPLGFGGWKPRPPPPVLTRSR